MSLKSRKKTVETRVLKATPAARAVADAFNKPTAPNLERNTLSVGGVLLATGYRRKVQ